MALLAPESNVATDSSSPSASSPRTGLAPLLTSTKNTPSAAKNRFSTFSVQSNASLNHLQHPLSRPQSTAFPQFHSSLAYALVRDFAYPPFHPLHYGPAPPEISGISTPGSDNPRRVSDPNPEYDAARGEWNVGTWDTDPFPNSKYQDKDGPPWSEDDDLASPVVTASRHRKNKSSIPAFDDSRAHSGANGRLSQSLQAEFITLNNAPRRENLEVPGKRSSRLGTLSNRTYDEDRLHGYQEEDSDDERRFSRDYQFTIVSPDEEMHGRAVALFDFKAEGNNELSMREGMIILVSFRQGEGWLVAQDPKTGDAGLVPEEYVRLLRDIEGGYDGLMMTNGDMPDEARTPTQATADLAHEQPPLHSPRESGNSFQPVVSSFSTSRGDLEKFPTHNLNSPILSTPTEHRRNVDELLTSKAANFDTKPKERPTD